MPACGPLTAEIRHVIAGMRRYRWRHAGMRLATRRRIALDMGDVAIDRRGCGRWYPRMSPLIRVRVVVDTREVAGEMRACDRRYPRMSPPIHRHVGVDRRGSRRRHASVWPSTCGNVGRGMPRVAGDMAACHREHGRVPCVRRGPVQDVSAKQDRALAGPIGLACGRPGSARSLRVAVRPPALGRWGRPCAAGAGGTGWRGQRAIPPGPGSRRSRGSRCSPCVRPWPR